MTATEVCDRDCLAGHITAYLDARVAHDTSTLLVANTVKFTEDTVEMALGVGLWQTSSGLGAYLPDILDVRQ